VEVAAGAAPEEAGKGRFNTRSVAMITLALVLVLVFMVFFSHRGIFQIYRLKQDSTRLDEENQKLAEENARLARTIDRLRNDPDMIQDLIRRELNFVKKNEIIIQLPPKEGDVPVKAALLPDRPPAPAGEVSDKHRPRGQRLETADPRLRKP
jgi:cell division protein FtsB